MQTDPSDWLLEVASRDPQRLCIETLSGERWTYGELAQCVRRFAAALQAAEMQPGDRLVAQVEKSPQATALYLACLQTGAVFVPLNTAYTDAELEYFLSDAAPRIAFFDPARAATLRERARAVGVARVETLDASGVCSVLDKCYEHSPKPISRSVDTLASLLYTSGTTGRSKGAMLTRGNLISNARTLAQAWRFTEQDVLLHMLPIFHVHGLFVAINTVLASGAALLFGSKFDAQQALGAFQRCTVLMGVPTYYTRLLQQPELDRALTKNVRLFVSGSAPLLADTHRQFQARTGHSILERYGMSETLMNTSNPYESERIPGSVGLALPGVEVRITDQKTGAPLHDPDAIGMIEVRGPNVFAGYWRMPEKTAAEFRDGFFVTGDLGRIDARGYVYIVGRGKDLVITGGYNVYPIEIEQELDAMPGVVESAVFGVPHPDFGEAVTAIVVPERGAALTEHGVRAALDARLARFKLPKRVLFVDHLPRNAMGKVQKAALRAQYEKLYQSG